MNYLINQAFETFASGYNSGVYNGSEEYNGSSSTTATTSKTSSPSASTGSSASPSSPVSSLSVTSIGSTSFLGTSTILVTGPHPTISGTAPAYSKVIVTFHSVIATCTTTANSKGYWSCTLNQSLPIGIHEVDVSAITTSGQQLTYPAFSIKVMSTSTGSRHNQAVATAPSISNLDLALIIIGLIIAAYALVMLILTLIKRRKRREDNNKN